MIINKDIFSIICEHLSNENIIKLYDVFKLDIPIHIVKNMMLHPPLIQEIMDTYNKNLGRNEKYYRCSYEDAMCHYYEWIGLSNNFYNYDFLYDDNDGFNIILKYIKKCEKNLIDYLVCNYCENIDICIAPCKYYEEREDGIYLNNRKIDENKLDDVIKSNEKKILYTIREYIILNEDITYSNILQDKNRTKIIDTITEKIISEEMDIYVGVVPKKTSQPKYAKRK